MAPHVPRAAVVAPPTPDDPAAPKGPNPGQISIANQYTLEQKLRQMLRDNGCDPAREDSYRLQGIQLIDNVRESLQLPVRTFDTASNYYHKFRLSFRDAEYNYQDAALASLFVACKVEDTIKKSKEILCAAHNLKYPEHPLAQDDKTFEHPSKIIIGLERLILETIGFDFRARYPQKLLVKMVRRLLPPDEARDFLPVAYDMCLDIYKTFAPVKQTTFTMVLAVVELAALVTDSHVDRVRFASPSYHDWHTSRGCVVETMLDLLDLYTQFLKSTKVGGRFPLDKFIDVKIRINREVDDSGSGLSRFEAWCGRCEADDRDVHPITPGSATSPATTGSYPGGGGSNSSSATMMKRGARGNDSTMRFVFDADEARQETETVGEYFKEEFEEYEIEVEEAVPEVEQQQQQQRQQQQHHQQQPQHQHGQGQHRRRPGRNPSRNQNSRHNDRGWGPFHRNRHGPNDRPKGGGRKGGGGGGHGGYY